MAGIERQTTVNAPAAKVFEYVADIGRHGEWAAHRLEIEKTSEGPVGPGSTFACVGHEMGTHRGQVKVAEFNPNSKVVYEAEDDTGHFRHYFLLEDESGATRVTKGVEPLRMSLMFRVLSPIATTFLVPRGLEGDLKRIKAKLEGQGPTA